MFNAKTGGCYDKIYPIFNEGDEVFTTKETYKAISSNKPYIVLRCYTPPGFIDGYPVKMIEVVNDCGYISRYSTDKFKKTDRQLRADKVNNLLSD